MSAKSNVIQTDEYAVWLVPASSNKFRKGNEVVLLPEGWEYVPKGDAALTRRIKASGNYWVVMTHYKQKPTTAGLCAPQSVVAAIRRKLEDERADPGYVQKLEKGRAYRAKKELAYQGDFKQAILAFIQFHPRWAELADRLAEAVTQHSTPVGSGTVARTEMIPIEQRAEAAVIAWMRHQTTAYDKMYIPRVAGQRREVRHKLAEVSRSVLAKYHSGCDVDLSLCPLAQALDFMQNVKKV